MQLNRMIIIPQIAMVWYVFRIWYVFCMVISGDYSFAVELYLWAFLLMVFLTLIVIYTYGDSEVILSATASKHITWLSAIALKHMTSLAMTALTHMTPLTNTS